MRPGDSLAIQRIEGSASIDDSLGVILMPMTNKTNKTADEKLAETETLWTAVAPARLPKFLVAIANMTEDELRSAMQEAKHQKAPAAIEALVESFAVPSSMESVAPAID